MNDAVKMAIEALTDIRTSIECAAGCDEGSKPDAAYSEILSAYGTAMASAYSRAAKALAALKQTGEPVAWIDEAAPVTKVAWDKIAASLPEALEPMADDPLRSSLQGSFCVIESKGHPELGNRSYRMIFSFPTMAAMHAAHAAYIAGAAPLPTHQDLDAGAGQWGIDIVMDLDRRRVSVLARAGLLLSALIGKGEVGGQDPNELFAAVIMALGIEEEAHGNDIGALRDVAAHPEEHLISDRLIDLAIKRGKE